ncbi:MAG: hypothetical protein V3R77_00820 [Candidatus Binatia bacterium]
MMSRACLGCGSELRLLLIGLCMLAGNGCGDASPGGAPAGQTVQRDLECDVTFGVVDSGEFHEVRFQVDFAAAPGGFRGSGSEVRCLSVIPLTVVAARSHLGDRTPRPELTVLVAHENLAKQFGVPADIARCVFDTDSEPAVGEFSIEQSESGDGHAVQISVSKIACRAFGATTTSMTSSTTNTVEDACPEVDCAEGEACVAGACEMLDRYEIDFTLADDVVAGALQFDVDVSDAPGVFLFGDADHARCARNPDLRGGFEATHRCSSPDHCTDVDGHVEGSIVVAETSIVGMRGPVLITTCEFHGTAGPPRPDDFSITVVDASSPATVPIVPTPSVIVSAIRPILP